MSHYRKKPVVIEARQLDDSNLADIAEWAGAYTEPQLGAIVIRTLEGSMTAHPGDWVIRGVQGEFYPCAPAIFAATYEPVEATA